MRMLVCAWEWLFALTTAPDEALRLKPGRGLLGAELELPERDRRWFLVPVVVLPSPPCAWVSLFSLFRFFPNDVFRCMRLWPTTCWRWGLCGAGRWWVSGGDCDT